MKRAVLLIGMMGSGKTQVGQALARLLGRPWVDLDRILTQRYGPIPTQFKRPGEAVFRRREASELRSQAKLGRVLSTGGGVVLDAANRRFLAKQLCVYLQVPVPILFRRLKAASAGRPLLKGQPLQPRLQRLARERGRFYRECATFQVRAGHGTALQVATRIARRLKAFSLS